MYAVLGVFLIGAARNPSAHRSLILFTVWSSIVHAGIMAAQALQDGHESGHLVGDVPALLLVVAVLWYLLPTSSQEEAPSFAGIRRPVLRNEPIASLAESKSEIELLSLEH